MKIKSIALDLFILLAGAALPLAFAPLNFYFLAILSPAIFLGILTNTTKSRAFFRGWLYGIGFFGVGISWIYISVHEYGYAPIWFAAIFTTLFVFILALFPALQAFCLQKYFPKNNPAKFLLVFPSTWILLEWIRSWLFTGFPWLLLGHSQVTSSLRGYLPILGVYGTSFLIIFCSGLLTLIYFSQKNKIRFFLLLTLVIIFIAGESLAKITWTQTIGTPLQVSLIQGNIPQNHKWSPEYLHSTLKNYFDMTRAHLSSDIIFWPEAAIPLALDDAKDFINDVEKLARPHHTSIVLGVPIKDNNQDAYYNSVIVIGDGHGRYDKQHLVPFGEYVPFEKWLRGLMTFFDLPMSHLISGQKNQPLLTAKSLLIAPFVCYEIAYNRTVRKTLPKANLLLTMSNDAWFGDSFAPAQHLEIAQAQALQSQRFVIFVSNTGITAIVNPEGKIQSRIPQFQQAVLTDQITGMQGKTPWIYLGDLPWILMSVFLLLICFVSLRSKKI